MTTDRWSGVPDLLNVLEDEELRLLSWGVVDGFLSADEVEAAIDRQLDRDATDNSRELLTVRDYVEHLLDQGLLLRLPDPTPRYRTRLAETLRMLRNLRQLWPPADRTHVGWWRHASTLVADYRVRVGPRRYPQRDVTLAEAAVQLSEAVPSWTSAHAETLKRLVGEQRLARFQLRSTASILGAVASHQPTARIITAGTGSGKTLAFYLPALIDIDASASVKRSGPHTLALYPRNELLRDQARETLRQLTNLGPIGDSAAARPARIGLLYGGTPRLRDLEGSREDRGWKRFGQGWSSPYFPCPTENCQGTLVWSDTDRQAAVERLQCTVCGFASVPGMLALTRESLAKNPPDILFSSTEMLSQQSTSSSLARLLGWKGPNGTKCVLLDEVHTYTGVHGAQVGLMLRRWRHANRQWGASSPVMVGLSATLRDAGDFFSTLTGVDRSNVEVIAPAAHELKPIGREYGIVVRGDPISGAQLLSTTIQTSMLVGRVLDNTPGLFGSVAFAFTDDLDVINRLYDNLSDAEGAQPRGRARGTVLADLRSPADPQAGARYVDGQSWELPYLLRRMERPLRIARTSSQDAGVDTSADIVAATSSLEVGFNDPRVGAIIQHKAPRDLASFLQRRGRAGRRLEMRPMSVVVLSDYGRDRIAYQTYEKLLDPEIDARSLPISNRFVVKIQATHSLIDWLGRKTGADVRTVLSPPWGPEPHVKTPLVVASLRDLLSDNEARSELTEHLRRALLLSEDEANAAMWEEPRSLMRSVVPTALRRLEAAWRPLDDEVDPGAQERTPLPEFMTRTLFASLNTPDVRFELPNNFGDEPPPMPIAQALREAVPGRVSRRFGHAHASLRTWVPVPEEGTGLPLTAVIAAGHGLGTWTTSTGETYTVVRPLKVRLTSPPSEIADTSSAAPLWRSSFEYSTDALQPADIPKPSVWSSVIDSCAFALHVGGGPMRVRRMAIGSDGEVTYRAGGRAPLHVRYEHEGAPAAIGFELEVDAMILNGHLPDDLTKLLEKFLSSPQWRTLAFRRRVLEDERLDDIANSFQRGWLADGYLSEFVARGLATDDLGDIPHQLANGNWATALRVFLSSVARAEGMEEEESRVLKALEGLAEDPVVRSVVEQHGRLLVDEDLWHETQDLLDRVLVDSLSNAILTAADESLPDANEGDLAVDVEFATSSRQFRIVVSETTIGGLGLLETLQRAYVQDPRQFWDAVGRACAATEAEEVDEAMQAIVADLAQPDTGFAKAVDAFRNARSVAEMDQSLAQLRAIWSESDGPPAHLLISTFAARFLRPGSTPAIDKVVADLVQLWVQQEARLGVEIDARTLAHLASQGDLGVPTQPLTADSLFSLLWLRGAQARSERLEHWHPYRRDVVVERLLLAAVFDDNATLLDVTQHGWVQAYVEALTDGGRVILHATYANRAAMAEAIREVVVTPIELGGLRVFGRVVSIDQKQGELRAVFALAEEFQ